MEYLYPCKRIWDGYKIYARGASVIRKGFELVGAAEITDDTLNLGSTFSRRSESILEHQAKVAWLASAFMSNFPGFFGEQNTYVMSLDIWMIITTALCHDTGETIIGDIPDDGNPLHDKKDKAELEAFKQLLTAYGFNDRRELLEMFEAFQERSSHPAQALYALDKLEAVLTHLILEEHGIYGCISAKATPTDKDLYYAELAGSDAAADAWGVHMFSRMAGFPPEITCPVFAMLEVASQDSRGKKFPWLDSSV